MDAGRGLGGVPLDVEGARHRLPVRATPCLGGVVQQYAVRLVAEAPLLERHVAVVAGPHLRRLDLEAGPQTRAIELFHVQVRLALAHEPGPVVEPPGA